VNLIRATVVFRPIFLILLEYFAIYDFKNATHKLTAKSEKDFLPAPSSGI
jgi:hypothetical protein